MKIIQTILRKAGAAVACLFLCPLLLNAQNTSESRSTNLGEVSVEAGASSSTPDKDIYYITDSLRQGVSSTGELLGRLPNVLYNWYNKRITVFGQYEVILTVDGVEKDEAFIKEINPKRVRAVEISHNPGGRWLGEGLVAVIDIKLYEDYVGWDMTLENDARLKADRFADWCWLGKEAPAMTASYVRNKLTLNSAYSYMLSRISGREDQTETYPGVLENVYENTGDNIRKRTGLHNLMVGADYRLDARHTLSTQMTYKRADDQLGVHSPIGILTPQQYTSSLMQLDKHQTYDDVAAALYYNGRMSGRLSFYSDLTYNYYRANVSLRNDQEGFFNSDYRSAGRKNYIRYSAEALYTPSDRNTLKVGYSTTWKGYRAHALHARGWNEESDNYRNRLYAYYSHKFNSRLQFSAGSAFEWLRYNTSYGHNRHFAVMPDVRIMYQPGRRFNATVEYTTNTDYPTLSQTAISTRADTLFNIKANPDLTQSVEHCVQTRVRLFGIFTLQPFFKWSGNQMNDIYLPEADHMVALIRVNATYRQCALALSAEKVLWRRLILSGTVTYAHTLLKHQGLSHCTDSWTTNAMAMYLLQKQGLRLLLQYQDMTSKMPKLQGPCRQGDGMWLAAVIKSFRQDRISLMLAYLPPLSLGINKVTGMTIDTPYYRTDRKTYNFNMLKNSLLMRLNVRLHHGKRIIRQSHTMTTDKETLQ